MGKVSIIQPVLRNYRTKLFEFISNYHEVEVFFYKFSEVAQEDSSFEIKKLYPKDILPLRSSSSSWIAAKESNVLIVGFDLRNVFFWQCLINKNLRNKTLLWGHGPGKSRLFRVVRGWLIKFFPAIVVYEKAGFEWVVATGLERDKVFLSNNTMWISNSLDTSSYEKKKFIYTGRIQERKELNVLIDAYKIYKSRFSGVYDLLIVGDGEADVKLKEKCEGDEDLINVKFVSATYDEDELLGYFRESAAYISPGHVGLGVLHAFSYGVPVVTFRDRRHAPEFSWVKDSVNGKVLPPDVVSLAECLLDIESNKDIWEKMGESAYQLYSKEAGPHIMGDVFIKAISKVAKCGSS